MPVTFGGGPLAFLGPSCGAIKLSARRTASLRPSDGYKRGNGAETLSDSLGVNRDEFARAPWGRGKGLLPVVLCHKQLVDPVYVAREVNVASWYAEVLVVANPEPPGSPGSASASAALLTYSSSLSPKGTPERVYSSSLRIGVEVQGASPAAPSTRHPKYPESRLPCRLEGVAVLVLLDDSS